MAALNNHARGDHCKPSAWQRRHVMVLGAAFTAAWLAGCAQLPHGDSNSNRNSASAEPVTAWSGRLSLRLDSQPVQSFAALFDLRGNASAGELTLTTPIGSTLAAMHWSPGAAVLKNGGETRHFDSLDALIEAATGAAIPVGALFGWLAGRADKVPGWQPDLSQIKAGRLQATRSAPAPSADLRIAFEAQ